MKIWVGRALKEGRLVEEVLLLNLKNLGGVGQFPLRTSMVLPALGRTDHATLKKCIILRVPLSTTMGSKIFWSWFIFPHESISMEENPKNVSYFSCFKIWHFLKVLTPLYTDVWVYFDAPSLSCLLTVLWSVQNFKFLRIFISTLSSKSNPEKI